jgi:hypothetical protein
MVKTDKPVANMTRADVTVKQVDRTLWRRVRATQVEQGLTMAQALEEALRLWLERR